VASTFELETHAGVVKEHLALARFVLAGAQTWSSSSAPGLLQDAGLRRSLTRAAGGAPGPCSSGSRDRRKTKMGAFPVSLWLRRGPRIEPDAVPSTCVGSDDQRRWKSFAKALGTVHNVWRSLLAKRWKRHLVRVGQSIPRNGFSSPLPNNASVLQTHASAARTLFVRVLL